MVRLNRVFIISVIVLLLDQISKAILKRIGNFAIVDSVLEINIINNTGAGFSILNDMNGFLIWSTIIIVGLIFYYLDTIEEKLYPYICLIIGGAIGNLIDRIRLGYVTDFIDFKIWPIFNLADTAITIGGIMVLYHLAFKKDKTLKVN